LDELCNTMRTSILTAAILGLFAVGCAGELSGTGDDGGDDVQPGICGDGALNSGEACDDGNTTAGDGCSASCANESAVPRVQVAMDKTTLPTDLYVDNEINLTLTAMNGFAGDVTLAASVVDGTGAAITGWTTELSATTVTLAADGTGTAKLKVRVPGDTASLTGTVKIAASSSAAPQEASLAVTGSNKAIVRFTTSGSNCINSTLFNQSNPVRVKVNRMVSIVNGSDPAGTACGGGACKMQIHFDGGTGVAHQNNQMVAGASYDQIPNVANATGSAFYCHNANQADTATELSGQVRLRLVTVP
jgi:cysteine-rich repeat protein